MTDAFEWNAEGWPPGFAWGEEAAGVLQVIDAAFIGVQRPSYFTNADHCPECCDHDLELKARPRTELRRGDLGNPGWDPISAASPQGIAYLMPAMARYAMAPDFWPDRGWYADQMVFHLAYDGHSNRLMHFCNPAQRRAVVSMIVWMIDHRAGDLADYHLADEWLKALEIWQA